MIRTRSEDDDLFEFRAEPGKEYENIVSFERHGGGRITCNIDLTARSRPLSAEELLIFEPAIMQLFWETMTGLGYAVESLTMKTRNVSDGRES